MMQPYEALQRLIQQVLTSADTERLLGVAVETTAQALGASGAALWEQDEDGRFRLLAAHGWEAPPYVAPAPEENPPSLLIHTLRSQASVIVPALSEAPSFQGDGLLDKVAAGSCVSTVIVREGRPRGVLLAVSDQAGAFDEPAALFLQAVAGILSGAFARGQAEAALRESEARARAVLETTVDAIITIDPSGRIESFNPAAERLFGYAAHEAVGQNVRLLMPEPYRSEHDSYLEAYRTTGRRKIIGIGREVRGRRRDGTVFPMYLAVSEVTLPDRRLFTGIVRDITPQRQLEQEVLRVSEDERRRIGQDLHDGLGQMLTGIGLIAANLSRRLRRADAAAADAVAELAEIVKEADQYARGLAHVLVPVELEQGGLRGALRRLAATAERLFGVRCTYADRGTEAVPEETTAMHLYRIAQEAVSNAVRHGKATTVTVTLDAASAYIRLRIQDDGVGLASVDLDAPPEALEGFHGMGVRIMHYRARIINASLEIYGQEGEGTSVTCTLRRDDDARIRPAPPSATDAPATS